MNRFPPHITEAMSICALRFDGYQYEETMGLVKSGGLGEGISQLIRPIVESLTLHADDNHNFAAFFGLQRYLYKWGGEYLTKYADEHIAYDFLFLHLYHREVPEAFRHEEYWRKWQERYATHREAIAAFVRQSFQRRGQGTPLAI